MVWFDEEEAERNNIRLQKGGGGTLVDLSKYVDDVRMLVPHVKAHQWAEKAL